MKTQNIAECIKCKKQYAFDMGRSNDFVKDQNGKRIEGAELDHYVKNRFVCPDEKCKTE